MIYGLGIDLEHTSSLKKSLENTGDNFVKRLLTSREKEDYKTIKDLTCFFTAKEAFYKALGTGIMNGFSLLNLEIIPIEGWRRIDLNYYGNLKSFMKENNLHAFLDITYTKDIALSKAIVYKK